MVDKKRTRKGCTLRKPHYTVKWALLFNDLHGVLERTGEVFAGCGIAGIVAVEWGVQDALDFWIRLRNLLQPKEGESYLVQARNLVDH
jgi:hypothetical protein